jgi:hypothetical protein
MSGLKQCRFIKHFEIKRISGAHIDREDGNILKIISKNCN